MPMLTQVQLASLSRSLHDRWVLSVFLDTAVTDPGHRADWRLALDNAIRAIRREAHDEPHAVRTALDRCTQALEVELARPEGLPGPGWAAFISDGVVLHAGATPSPLPTIVRWQRGPAIAPYLRALAAETAGIIVVGDSVHVDIDELRAGALTRVDRLHAHHALEEPAHLGRAPRSGFHTGTRGGVGRDRAQRALAEGTARMQREAVARVLELDRELPILVAGPPPMRAALAALLEAAAPGRVTQLHSVDAHATPAAILDGARKAVADLRTRRLRGEVETLIELTGARGPAVVGPDAADWALGQARVQTLYLTPSYLDAHHDRAETEVRAALAQDALVDELSGEAALLLDRHGGVAARLRYGLA